MKTDTIITKYGLIEGFVEDEINKFFGIPFAAPPVGELRFKRAVEPTKHKELIKCEKMSPKPVQMAGGMFEKLTSSEMPESEDCLYLNIWAPKKSEEKKPVFVWIYGGGHYAGEASAVEYDLSSFAKEGVVAVNFNYRLGALGCYDFSEYGDEFDSNCALSDMIMALKWIHENIEAFGGDKDNVTLAGESAGATATLALSTSPAAKGYFNKAIIMSMVVGTIVSKQTKDTNLNRFFEKSEIKREASAIKNADINALKKGCRTIFEDHNKNTPGMMTNGFVLDDLLPQDPMDALAAGEAKDIKMIFGTCRDEGALFYFMKLLPQTWGEILKMLMMNGYSDRIADIEKLYDKMNIKAAIKAANRDCFFYSKAIKAALMQSEHQKTYVYRFDFVTIMSAIAGLGATHTMDICPALNTTGGHSGALYSKASIRKVKDIYKAMHQSFLQFIKNDNPTVQGLPKWDDFEKWEMNSMVFDTQCHLESRLNYKNYKLWADIDCWR